MKEFEAYAIGLIYASCCSSLSAEDTEKRLNAEHPAGTMNGWKIAEEPFKSGQPNPCPCHDHPDTHKHYLFWC